jgi:serine/threonine-protein kinase
LAGLHYAHELTDFDGTPLGVVHRDFTPHNVFVTFEGQVKVLDFGIAKLNVSSVETRTGMVKGKIRYMPPEQILGRAVDRRADIYAAGVMLWQAATGVPLWRDQADAAIMMQVAHGEIPTPETVNPDVHPQLARICVKALAFDPAARHESAAELENELEEVLRDLGDHVTSRDVGRVVSDLFLDLRQSTKMMIEQQLSGSVSRTWPVRLPEVAIMGSDEASARRDTRSATEVAPLKPTLQRRGVAIAAGAILALLGVALLLWIRPRASAPEPSVSSSVGRPAAAVSSAPPSSPPARLGKLRLSAQPAEARLFLDGELLPSNPHERSLPLDGAQHDVRAELRGYVAKDERLVLERDVNLELRLERARPSERVRTPPPVSRRPSAPQPAPSQPKAAGSTAVSGTNCNRPFFIDERGIKRMLPECL